MKKKSKEPRLASVIGHGFAYVQHGTDRVIEWGFAKMREAKPSDTEPTEDQSTVVGRLLHAGRKTIAFLGDAGDAYYERYEELKRKK